MKKPLRLIIIGAGPSGLGAALELTEKRKLRGGSSIVLIDKNNSPGGLARTTKFMGHHFDIGPHRFYTKNKEVLEVWKKVLGKDFHKVKRLTRMYYKGKLFLYPIELKDVIIKFGAIESIVTGASFLYAKIFLRKLKPKSFEQWIIKNFGKKLYLMFFKSYTEKVWGIPCNKISTEWASQRIKNLNFTEVVRNAIFPTESKKANSLVSWFYYPSKGAGQMYQKIADSLKTKGVRLNLESEVTKIIHKNHRITEVECLKAGKTHKISVSSVFSSMPITHFIDRLDPPAPKEIIEASHKLLYRDHITVNFVLKDVNIFPDNWIYIHDPRFKMARISNYNSFHTNINAQEEVAIAVEYFVFKKEHLWKMSDNKIISFAASELKKAGFISKDQMIGSFVTREADSYPTYYTGFLSSFNVLKNYLDKFENLHPIGRGGMYKYNNMDDALYSGILAARNFALSKKKQNLWDLGNADGYLESED